VPAVSVLLPVHDGEAYLAEAIASVLRQTHGDLELIVLDDGSRDRSRAIAASFQDGRLQIVSNETRRGLIATLNHGLSLANGALVARQDADDMWSPRRLERQVRFLEAHPKAALVGGQGRLVDEEGRFLRNLDLPCHDASLRWALLFDNPFIHSSVTFRRDVVWGELGGYAEARYCEDYELWSRVAATHEVANLPERVVTRRSHRRSVLKALDPEREAEADAGNLGVVRANLDRVFGGGTFAEADARLVARLRRGVRGEDFARFLRLLERLRDAYKDRVPAEAAADFRRTRAVQLVQVAHGLWPSRRGLAARAALRAFILSPAASALLARQGARRAWGWLTG
jgi:glycosyltransferase involved in cell wall biosynthesis